jgi:hypothetical protein
LSFIKEENLLYVTSDALKTNEFTFHLVITIFNFLKILIRFSSGKQTLKVCLVLYLLNYAKMKRF